MGIIPSSSFPKFTSFSPLSDISCSPNSDFFYSQISSTMFSTPRNKSSCWSVDEKLSVSSTEEIDEEMNNLINLNAVYMQNRDSKEEQVEEDHNPIATKCLSYCTTEYKSFDARQPFVALPRQLPILVVNEEEEGQEEKRGGEEEEEEIEEKIDNGVSRNSIEESEISESPSINGHQRLITRPKPYHAFLHEIKKREVAEKANAWKEAKHLKLLNKLKRKEAAIDVWELQQTKKATLRMKKIECKLERKRAKAMQNMQKAISSTHRKAEEKKAKEKRTTLNKISKISRVTEKMKVTRSKVCLKVLSIF
ncbi:Remorin family protein [Thalictrum thalictroides]|uniref:Remorin family protein n=1 Tax=Thalictrum thalictroides TaxID=46969 RepID=A0A7J6X402_THATH|nr:Remorin family protein [Thalictrum thalictroides]